MVSIEGPNYTNILFFKKKKKKKILKFFFFKNIIFLNLLKQKK